MPKNRPFYVPPYTGWYYDALGVAHNLYSGVPSLLFDALGNPISSAGGALKVALYDAVGNPITSLRGGIDIHDADVHQEVITHYMYRVLGTHTLSSLIDAGDYQFTVSDATGIVQESYLHITDVNTGAHDHELLLVNDVTGSVVTVNRQIDWDYTIAGTTIQRVSKSANVVGSIASPVIYYIQPPASEVWHITGLGVFISDDAAMDDSDFGGLDALSNGIVLRRNSATTGYDTILHARYNSAFALKGFNIEYPAKAPAGTYSMRGRMDVKGLMDSVFRITSADRLEWVIQDDLSALLDLSFVVFAHIEGV